jgi:DNA replication protein DnaC
MDVLVMPCTPVVRGVPKSHWGCTFGNFDFGGMPELKAVTKSFVEKTNDFWVYAWGPTGRGKTHWAVALHRAMVARVGWECAESSLFEEWAPMMREFRASLDGYKYDDLMTAYLESETLVIDDLTGSLTDFQVKILESMISERHSGGKRLVITSNEPYEVFLSRFAAHEISRIRSICAGVEFSGPDRRLLK